MGSWAPALPNMKPHTWIFQSSPKPQKVWSIHPSIHPCTHLWELTLDEKHLDQFSQTACVCVFSHVFQHSLETNVCTSVYVPVCDARLNACVYVSWLVSGVFRNLGSAHIPEAHMIWWYVFFFPPLWHLLMRNTCPSSAEIKDANRAITHFSPLMDIYTLLAQRQDYGQEFIVPKRSPTLEPIKNIEGFKKNPSYTVK